MTRDDLRSAILRARAINRMLQGTMGLEGQGLDKSTLREMKRRTIREILANKEDRGSGCRVATAAELDAVLRESWKRCEEGYRYLAGR